MKQIMVHACCAVCAGYPLTLLKSLDFEPVVYFYNPNIHPKEEYERRLDELIRYCSKYNFKLIIDDSSSDEWFEYVKGLENEPERGERCKKCFELRLNKTAERAKQENIDTFTTTLFISPHKVRKDIIEKSLTDYGAVIVCNNLSQAIDFANELAPEHLELCVKNPVEYIGRGDNAGSVFLGNYSPESVGDYYAGPNHVLPTGGTARFFSPLSVDSFIKKSSFIYYTSSALDSAKDNIITLADAEGLTAHANAVAVRFK